MAAESFSGTSSMNSPLVVQPKMAMSSLSSNSLTAFLSRLFEIKQMANVGLNPSAILCSNADFISSVYFPLIDFAFIIIF
jgi:hypothetical protein